MAEPEAGVDIEFESDGLRAGADAAAGTADEADPLIVRLNGLVIAAEPFGRVDLAEPLAAALSASRDAFRELAERVRRFHVDLDARARSAAGQGDRMVDDTARSAQGGRAGR
jgi:hypothetical protein